MKYENVVMLGFILIIICLTFIIHITTKQLYEQKEMLTLTNERRLECLETVRTYDKIISESTEEIIFSEDGLRKVTVYTPKIEIE